MTADLFSHLPEYYAMTELSYILARFVQRYDKIELAPDSAAAKHERIPKSAGPLQKAYELKCRLRRADS